MRYATFSGVGRYTPTATTLFSEQCPARRRVSDPPTRHVNLLSVIGLEQEAKVEDTRPVWTRHDPVAAGTDDSALELWAFERPAQDRDDNPVHTNESDSICRAPFEYLVEQEL
jgi:hypothetical protein